MLVTVVGGVSGVDETPPFPPSKPGRASQAPPCVGVRVLSLETRKIGKGCKGLDGRSEEEEGSRAGLLKVLAPDLEVSELWKALS